MSIEDTIAEYIQTEILAPSGREVDGLGPETSLFREGIVDSFGLFALAAFLEERFGIVVGDEDMVPENFDSIARIARFVASRRDAAGIEQP